MFEVCGKGRGFPPGISFAVVRSGHVIVVSYISSDRIGGIVTVGSTIVGTMEEGD